MLRFFRHIKQKMLKEGQLSQYLLYALGEILLVVLGILLALQINNWSEDKKNRQNEVYILAEIVNNLKEDAGQIATIIQARQDTKVAVNRMLRHLSQPLVPADTIAVDLGYFLKFERYYPIYVAYEMMKSTGLKISNRQLRTAIGRYYDFEQNKVTSGIEDIEKTFLSIMNSKNAIKSNLAYIERVEGLQLVDANDPLFKKELLEELVAFRGNNNGTLEKLLVFRQLNQKLIALIVAELKERNMEIDNQ